MEPKLPQLPFITREMFAFDHGASYEIRVVLQTDVAGTIALLGTSREAPFRYDMTPVADGSSEVFTFRVTDIPTFLTLFHASGAYEHGSCYARVYLRINGVTRWMMAAGFMSAQQQLSWPMQVSKSPIPGRGRFRTVSSADPGNQVEASITVPNGQLYKVNSVNVQLVTDGTAADRRVHFVFTNAAGSVIDIFAGTNQTASLTWNYSVAKFGLNLSAQHDNDLAISLPEDIWLDEGSTIETATLNIQATDNYGVMNANIEQFWEGE